MGDFYICTNNNNQWDVKSFDSQDAANAGCPGGATPASAREIALYTQIKKLNTDLTDANDKYTTLANAPKDNGWVMNTVEDAFPSALGTGIVLGMSSTAKPAAVWELAINNASRQPPAATTASLFRAAGTTAFKRAGLAGGLASGVITYYGRKDEVDDGYITQDQFMYEVGSEAACGFLVAGISSAVGLAVAGACVGSAVPGAGTILGFAAGLTVGLIAAYAADQAQEAIGHEVITDYQTKEMVDASRAERRAKIKQINQSN